MATLRSIHDNYHGDTAVEVVARFVGVAGTWRGPTARRIKTELKGILAMHDGEKARRPSSR
jgi:hypothetical protein